MTTFAIAALVLIMLPGPDQALITRNALVGGRYGGLLTMLGGVLGLTVHAGAAALGLSAVLLASATAFTVLRIVGAVYLLWLAAQMLWSATRSRRMPAAEQAVAVPVRRSAYLRQGFLSNALNPKVALFFVTFLPQFCQPEHGPIALQIAVLGLVSVAFNTAADVVIAFAAGPLGRRLKNNARWWRRQRRATGTVLVGLGVYAAR